MEAKNTGIFVKPEDHIENGNREAEGRQQGNQKRRQLCGDFDACDRTRKLKPREERERERVSHGPLMSHGEWR
jgi:hypothetical protein